jgi:cyclic pyranopterin monophosphate synthase
MKKLKLSHVNAKGKAAMVGVGHKPVVQRRAVAEGVIHLQAETVRLLKRAALPKGDVLTVAQIAGIMGAKKTSELIPLCHALALDRVQVDFLVKARGIEIVASAETSGKTGVEMEALTAVSIAALTLYDMCKAVDKTMVIGPIRLKEKTKGKVSA